MTTDERLRDERRWCLPLRCEGWIGLEATEKEVGHGLENACPCPPPRLRAILGSITFTAVVSYWVLAAAGKVRDVLGETGIRILVRIMDFMLVALAMHYFVNGITDLGLIPRR